MAIFECQFPTLGVFLSCISNFMYTEPPSMYANYNLSSITYSLMPLISLASYYTNKTCHSFRSMIYVTCGCYSINKR